MNLPGIVMPPAQMPALSRDLRGPRRPDTCQSCGLKGCLDSSPSDYALRIYRPSLTAWREHDAADKPTETMVVLCNKCEERLIEKHPRLYDYLPQFYPYPGVMPICAKCAFQSELRCTHPDAKANGGSGVILVFPKPERAHVLYSRSIKGIRGEFLTTYHAPVECRARTPIEAPKEDADAQ